MKREMTQDLYMKRAKDKSKKNRKKKSGIQKEPKYEEDVEDTEIEPPRSTIYYV